ncbi:peptide MFS transporter [Chryseobacterium sp. Ch-15]|uniref:Peptide MFS transporter n=1 Tax=Chryseobacterium muglaense TaxID=2893752 RepID=A0A9Q3UW24_9FLAO|nr:MULTISPECIES: peptide MFS transporter [Chryseobacterium]MBD3904846.1 peptide MFS transporter [Chryseobacterium muglaense]MBO6185204.1 peptide MFS transporter [Chryseobacterium sp.]MCC9034394.1 peptide MFS transporter [Chryseobacterium muglaense]MCM2554501.1 peptide MFS transporter [Chryseobacterium muglaense]
MDTVQKKGHPKGLYLLFFTEMWERFSYYGMRAILILYLTKKLIEGGLGMDEQNATLLYGYFTGLVYFTPLIGGWLADKFLGKRLAITIGGITMMIGQFVLFGMNSTTGLYIGLALLIIGNGFFKPNISTLVGGLYPDGDDRRDSAFSIFYMGINLGALIAPFIIGYFTDNLFATTNADGSIAYGYRYGFLAAGVGMFLGQIVFNTFAQKYLGDLGSKPVKNSSTDEKSTEASSINPVTGKPLTKPEEGQRITVIFILFLFAVFFWAGFEQAGSSLSLYTDKFINRNVFGFEIPTSWFQSVNPIFIVTLAPLFAIFWSSKLGKKLSTPVKMGVGMIILGIGFWFMLGAVAERNANGDIADIANKAGIMWLIMTYLLHTIGELCLSPVGLSVVTKLSPPKLASILMAVWMLSSSIANFIGGFLASIVETLGAGQVFTYISGFVIVCGILLLLLSKYISKMMHGVK